MRALVLICSLAFVFTACSDSDKRQPGSGNGGGGGGSSTISDASGIDGQARDIDAGASIDAGAIDPN